MNLIKINISFPRSCHTTAVNNSTSLLGVFYVTATAKTRSHDKPDQRSSRLSQSLAAPWKFQFKTVYEAAPTLTSTTHTCHLQNCDCGTIVWKMVQFAVFCGFFISYPCHRISFGFDIVYEK
jgi:hypothetical protein